MACVLQGMEHHPDIESGIMTVATACTVFTEVLQFQVTLFAAVCGRP